MVQYYVGEYGLDIRTAALLAACFSLPGGVLRAVGGWISDKYGAHSVVISARSPRSRAAMSSSSRKVPWLIMICRENGSVSGSRRVRSQRSTISSGVHRSTSQDCRLWE